MPARRHGLVAEAPQRFRLPLHQRQQHAEPREDLEQPLVLVVDPQFAMVPDRALDQRGDGMIRNMRRARDHQLLPLGIETHHPAQRPFSQVGVGIVEPERLHGDRVSLG